MVVVSTNKEKLDIPFIQHFLKDIYWEAPRTIEAVQKVIDSSVCFGVYLDDEQIGFGRLITDYVVFAYLMDVFITPEHRGKGYSSILVKAMLEEPSLKEIKIWRLATRDAQFLYEKFGFKVLAHPERMMEKIIQ